MNGETTGPGDLDAAADYVASVQRPDGLIPWHRGGPADPWDHVESAMGLSVAGRYRAAERAYRWFAGEQRADGSVWAVYEDGEPGGIHRETHHAAYLAVGAWHHFLVTGDREFLEGMWPAIDRGLSFALDHQAEGGEVFWAVDADGVAWDDALVTGCSSIYKSVECGLAAADLLGRSRPGWEAAYRRLGGAIRAGDRFDRTWESKGRYAMDWFYPVLCGAVAGTVAHDRIGDGMDRFVEAGIGCRCVADEPWATAAETAELAMAMAASGHGGAARRTLGWLRRFRDGEGAFWIGYQFENDELWPDRRPTWTAGAVLLAADAVSGATPAAGLFTGDARAADAG